MRKIFTIIVGFIHDFAAGCWLATVLAVYWLDIALAQHPELTGVLKNLQKEFFYIGLACVGIVFLAGIGRTFTYAYIGNVYGKNAEPLRRKMLIVKHIALIIVFGLGIYWQWRIIFSSTHICPK